MTLQDLGNLGELIGGIGVVISFLFLAWQIRQNSKMIKAQIRQSYANNAVHGTMEISSNADLRRLIHKVNVGEELTSDDEIVWWAYLYASMHLWENQYIQIQMGTIPANDWQVQKNAITELKLHKKWLENNWVRVRSGFSPEFRDEIDKLLQDDT